MNIIVQEQGFLSGAGQIVQQLGALAVLPENLGSVLRTYVDQTCLYSHLQGIQYPLLTTRHTYIHVACIQTDTLAYK